MVDIRRPPVAAIPAVAERLVLPRTTAVVAVDTSLKGTASSYNTRRNQAAMSATSWGHTEWGMR